MNTNKKVATVRVDFYLADDLTAVSYEKIQKRVQRYINGTEVETTASFFTSRQDVSVIIIYDITNLNVRNAYDYLGKRLKVLIDGHKEAATYGWDTTTITQKVVA